MEPEMTVARRTIEERYGPIGTGGKVLFLQGVPMGLRKIARKLALLYEDLVPIDAGTLPSDRHWIRFYDREDRRYVVFEFDGDFDLLEEHRADSLAWEGEDFFRQHTG